jgi:MFS family permease
MCRQSSRYRDVLRYRDFRVMLTAFLIDQIGSWAYNVVLIVYVYQRTGSTTWVAATTAAGWLPRILFSAYAGVLADRFERTRMLLVSALLALVLMAAITAVMATGGPIVLVLLLAAAAPCTCRPPGR